MISHVQIGKREIAKRVTTQISVLKNQEQFDAIIFTMCAEHNMRTVKELL